MAFPEHWAAGKRAAEISKNKSLAVESGACFFEGATCKKCGGTKRLTVKRFRRNCVQCMINILRGVDDEEAKKNNKRNSPASYVFRV